MNRSGKVLTIFLVIVAILLISLTAISMFFFQKETELRQLAEGQLEQLRIHESKLSISLQEAQKKSAILEEKNKEADEQINSLLDDIELEKGLRQEIKDQNVNLQNDLEAANEKRSKLEKDFEEQKKRAAALEAQLEEQKKLREESEASMKNLEGKMPKLAEIEKIETKEIKLEKIIIASEDLEGKVLSVDNENGFLIFNLGQKDSIAESALMSIYRGKKYLGDVAVTRVQSAMSAADFIPPLTGRKVRKNDRVLIKK